MWKSRDLILATHKPQFGSVAEFLAYKDAIRALGDCIRYTGNGDEVKL